MTTDEIVKYGTPIQSPEDYKPQDTFVWGGRQLPKFKYYEYKGEDYAVPTNEYKAYLKEKEEARLAKIEGEFKRTLDDYLGKDTPGNIPKLRRYVQEFETKYFKHSLYIWSRFNSTQKTTTARAVLKGIKDTYGDKFSCFFVLANTLMNDLKNYDFDDDAKKRVEFYKDVDFLIVDDAFTGDKVTKYSSGYQTSFLDTFLRERLEVKRRATCFTSNIPIKEIGQYWGPSIEALVNRTSFAMEFNDVLGKDTDFDINHIFD